MHPTKHLVDMPLIICCDVDPDCPSLGGVRFNVPKDKLIWMGITRGIPKIVRALESVEDSYGNRAKVTWFFRSDEQMHLIYGDHAWPLNEFRSLWKSLESRGDEIGWHPHLWRWSEKCKCWFQEVNDEEWITKCLHAGFLGFFQTTGFIPTSVRTGWNFHNNLTMEILQDLKVPVDLSALPGVKRLGMPDRRGSCFINECDWEITPTKPYYPSVKDYRRAAIEGEASLDLVEMPITTYVSLKHFFGRMLRTKRLTFSLPKAELSLLAFPQVFRRVLHKKISRDKDAAARASEYIAVYFHPYDIFRYGSMSNLEANLKTIKNAWKDHSRAIRFLTAKEAAEIIPCET
jgi:hypothetical protein